MSLLLEAIFKGALVLLLQLRRQLQQQQQQQQQHNTITIMCSITGFSDYSALCCCQYGCYSDRCPYCKSSETPKSRSASPRASDAEGPRSLNFFGHAARKFHKPPQTCPTRLAFLCKIESVSISKQCKAAVLCASVCLRGSDISDMLSDYVDGLRIGSREVSWIGAWA